MAERLLVEIRDTAARAGAGFLLVGLADPVAVMPRGIADAVLPEGYALDRDRPTRRLESLAHSHGFDFVSLVTAFREQIGDSEAQFAHYYLPCDGHPTVAGHALAVDTVAERVLEHVRGSR